MLLPQSSETRIAYRIVGGLKSRLQIIRRVAGDARPDLGRGAADPLAISLGARASHADGHRGRRRQSAGHGLKMANQLWTVQEPQIGWSESGLPENGGFVLGDDDGGAAGAAFD